MAKNFKPNGLGILSIVFMVASAVIGIGSSIVNDRKNQAYLDNKFDDWTKTKN